MRLLMLHVVADGLEVWLILGYVKFHVGVHPLNEIVGLSLCFPSVRTTARMHTWSKTWSIEQYTLSGVCGM